MKNEDIAYFMNDKINFLKKKKKKKKNQANRSENFFKPLLIN